MAERLESAPLYLAATRPAMIPFLGVTYHAGLVLLTVAGLIVIYMHNLLYEAFVLPVWGVLVALLYHDHNALRVLDLWSRTSLISLFSASAARFGGASPNPAPVRRSRKSPPRGIAHAA